MMMMNYTINPPTPCLWQAPASAHNPKKENQAGHSSERAVEGQEEADSPWVHGLRVQGPWCGPGGRAGPPTGGRTTTGGLYRRLTFAPSSLSIAVVANLAIERQVAGHHTAICLYPNLFSGRSRPLSNGFDANPLGTPRSRHSCSKPLPRLGLGSAALKKNIGDRCLLSSQNNQLLPE